MNKMDEKQKFLGNFFKLNALRKGTFLKEQTKWSQPSSFREKRTKLP
jgi:hypothetical protein